MAKAYLFKDKDGDYIVANAPKITDGVQGWALEGGVDEVGGPVAALNRTPPLVLLLNLGTFNEKAEEELAKVGNELVGEVDIKYAPWDSANDDDYDDGSAEIAADTDGE